MSEVNCSQEALATFVARYLANDLSGAQLAELEKAGTISKTDRRKIVKLAHKPPPKELTARQKLRLEVKEKKAQPRKKLSYDERKEKYSDVDERVKERYDDAASKVVCLGCRKRGHFLKDCPLALSGQFDGSGGGGDSKRNSKASPFSSGAADSKAPSSAVAANASAAVAVAASSSGNGGTGGSICFNCGSSDHALRACPVPRSEKGVLKYASCFVCKAMGHISRDCPRNLNGLYPQGGCCHICRQTTHLVRDCPQRTEEDRIAWLASVEAEKQRKEDDKLGPRVKGLVAGDDDDNDGNAKGKGRGKGKGKRGGGDDYGYASSDGGDDSNDDGGEGKAKKRKSSKEHKHKKSKRDH
jgi:hypothetical protein